MIPLYLIFPLTAAILYALGSIFIKRALVNGAPARGSFHLSNIVLGALFLPLLGFGWDRIAWGNWVHPVLTGVLFFFGMWLTFISIQRGDVSLVTPIMGTKVVFVALGVVLLTEGSPSRLLWIAAVLTAGGILVMGIRDMNAGPKLYFTVAVTLMSAALFGISDVLVQKWATDFSQLPFLAIMAATVTGCSLVAWLMQRRPELTREGSRKLIWIGSLFTGVQAILIGVGLAFFDDATGVNIVYASRGLWAILLIFFLGSQLGNRERETAGSAFLWRAVGTAMLTAAIVLAVWDRSQALI